MKIQDIELKGVSISKGHEGEELIKANIYFKNKKVGFYSEGDWGGPTDFKAPKEVVAKLAEIYKDFQFVKKDFVPLEDKHRAEFIIQDILVLKEWESDFKRTLKKHGEGTKTIVFAFYDGLSSIRFTRSFDIRKGSIFELDDEKIKKVIEQFKEQNSPKTAKYYRVFKFEDLKTFEMEYLTDRVVKEGEVF